MRVSFSSSSEELRISKKKSSKKVSLTSSFWGHLCQKLKNRNLPWHYAKIIIQNFEKDHLWLKVNNLAATRLPPIKIKFIVIPFLLHLKNSIPNLFSVLQAKLWRSSRV